MQNRLVLLDSGVIMPGSRWWSPLCEIAEVVNYDDTPLALIGERCSGAQMLLTNKTPLDAALIDSMPELRYIGVMATGYNNVDVLAAARRGIAVTNVPAYSTASVAQLTIAHLLNITTRVAHYSSGVRRGLWSSCGAFSYCDEPLTELAGKRLGIVGLGSIGQAVARIAQALGMAVTAFTSKSEQQLQGLGVAKAASLDELLSSSDVVTLHCPLTGSTRHLIDERALALMKPTAILINTSRGAVVSEKALAHALKNGVIAAAAIDVMEQEPPEAHSPLFELDNCYVTPHVGWASTEAQKRLIDTIIANVKAFVSGAPQNVVNL